MRRFAILTIVVALAVAVIAAAPRRRTSKDVRRERQRTEQQIAKTRGQIKKNEDETRRQLNRLTSLEANIALKNDTIGRLSTRLDSLNARIGEMNDSIATLTQHSEALKASYARTLRGIRARRQGMSDMAFIFSAETFSQAWRRIRYMRETARYNSTQTRRVEEATRELTAVRERLDILREAQAADLGRLNDSRRRLANERASADVLVSSLRRKGKNLSRELKRRRDQAAALDRELNRIIEREIREAEERRRREEAERRKAEEEARRKAEAEAGRKDSQPAGTSPGRATAPKKTAPDKPTPAKDKPTFTSEAAADRALTGGFKANKGRLLFPVAGRYTIISKFGTNTHPELAKVKMDNLGIDIEVPAGATARAVYEGVVSSIFRLEGYNNIVIVRHGEYLTVYGGLDKLNVKKGDKVRTGQQLGSIYIDRTDDNRTRLHFEIRREKQKLNPVEWVR